MYRKRHILVSDHGCQGPTTNATDVAMQAVVAALHAAAGRRNGAFRARALAALDKVLAASGLDLYSLVSELLLSGCLAAGKPPKSQVGSAVRVCFWGSELSCAVRLACSRQMQEGQHGVHCCSHSQVVEAVVIGQAHELQHNPQLCSDARGSTSLLASWLGGSF